ncbi:MAG: hypothetical protein H5U40_03625, partial [Polyangiaceae bacterium]|nr:hypothetical protein [Polyangiaceae bacterium]
MSVGSEPRPIRIKERHAALVASGDGTPHRGSALELEPVPAHPFMAEHGLSCMHSDPYTTNTYEWSGPLGHDPEVISRSMGFLGGECPTINFDGEGRIVTVCVRGRSPTLMLLDPTTLRVLARRSLPRRRTPIMRIREISADTSGGAYFYLDHLDRSVVGTADGKIAVIAVVDGANGPR